MNKVLISTNAYKNEPLELVLNLFRKVGFLDIDLHIGQIYMDIVSPIDANLMLVKLGITPHILSGGWCDFFTNSDYIEHTFISIQKQVDIAKALNCNKIRLFFGRLLKEHYTKTAKENIVGNLKKLSDLYLDISFVFENHDGISLIPEKCKEIIEDVNRPNIKINFDPINFEKAGVDSYHAFNVLQPLIGHVHLKGVMNGQYCEFGEGDVNLENMIIKLYEEEYSGLFSIEYEGQNDKTISLLKSYKIFKGVLK